MACSWIHCTSYCTNYGCVGRYRGPRTGNPYSFPDIGTEPTADFTNHLKNALNIEINERNQRLGTGYTGVGFTNAVQDSSIIAKTSNEVLVELKNRINAIHSGWNTDTYTQGSLIHSYQWTNIRDQILQLMRECLCNGDCGANDICTCYVYCGCNY